MNQVTEHVIEKVATDTALLIPIGFWAITIGLIIALAFQYRQKGESAFGIIAAGTVFAILGLVLGAIS